jgi:hypothetical protein
MTYITRAVFRAFNRDVEAAFYDNELHFLKYIYKRRVKKICPTAIVKSITHYKAEEVCITNQ